MAPFSPPPRVIAPSLTACVRRAPDTKGGVSRFSEHFTSFTREGTKANPPLYLRQGRGWALPSPPTCNLSLVGVRATLCFQDHSANKVLDYSYLQCQNICIKMGFFCPLRRAKRKLSQEPQEGTHEGKERKRFPNKDQQGHWIDLKLYFGIIVRKRAHLFLCFKFLLGFIATFIKEPNVYFA